MYTCIYKLWNSQAHRGFAANVESSNLSRDNLSREIGDFDDFWTARKEQDLAFSL